MRIPKFKDLIALTAIATATAMPMKADAGIINVSSNTLLSSPLVGISADAGNLYASSTGGTFKDAGKDLTFASAYANNGSVQDSGNLTTGAKSYNLELRDGVLAKINNNNEYDNQKYSVSSSYVGVGDAVNLNGMFYTALVKNIGSNNYRLELLNLDNGSITETDLAFNSSSAITGLGNSQGNSLESIAFLFTDSNKQILEGGVGQGIVETYSLNADYGNLGDITIDGNTLYLAGDDFGGMAGRVSQIDNFNPVIPEPASLALIALGGAGLMAARRYTGKF